MVFSPQKRPQWIAYINWQMQFILDSYAALNYLQDEAGTERIKEILVTSETGEMQTFLPLINLGEILYIVERRRGLEEAHRVLGALKQLPITIIPTDGENVLAAAHLKANYSISYVDAFVSYQQVKQVGFLVHPACPTAEAVPGLTCCPQAFATSMLRLPVTPTVV